MARLADADLSASLKHAEADERLAAAQRRLLGLRLRLGGLTGDGRLGPPVCIVFEGWDASGKGGAIKRLVANLDPRHVNVASFAAPTPREKRHTFLWRFWPSLPGWGGFSVFDRSWYGRVLVERVEGFAAEAEWKRAYGEINEFEHMLTDDGMLLIKFWMHISAEEQLERFEARAADPLKRWKLTDEDWRNRARRGEYERAVDDMLDRTDTEHARWHVVPAESKRYARVAVLETVVREIERAMRGHGLDPETVRARDLDA